MTHSEMFDIAARLLAPLGARALEQEVIDEDTLYVFDRAMGGGALLVGADGGVLYADSSISPEAHLEAFRAGARTPSEAFEDA